VNDDTKFAKAHQAIGRYFTEFSALERELGEAVKVVLDLEKHDAADVVVAALRYPSAKASLVRACAKIARKKDSSEASTEWKERADDTLSDIIKHSDGSRNTLAHSLLEPQEDGSVKVTKSTLSHRGQMTPGEPKTSNFKDEIDEVRRLTERLRDVTAELAKLEVPIRNLPMDWFQGISVPVHGAMGSPIALLGSGSVGPPGSTKRDTRSPA
jgi:hypothetical protein